MVRKLCNENVCVWKNEAPFSGRTVIVTIKNHSIGHFQIWQPAQEFRLMSPDQPFLSGLVSPS